MWSTCWILKKPPPFNSVLKRESIHVKKNCLKFSFHRFFKFESYAQKCNNNFRVTIFWITWPNLVMIFFWCNMFVKLFYCKELLFINKKKEINNTKKSIYVVKNTLWKKISLHEIYLVSISEVYNKIWNFQNAKAQPIFSLRKN